MAELSQEEMAVLNKLIYVDAKWWKGIGDRTYLTDIIDEWEQTNNNWFPENDSASQDLIRAVKSNDSLGYLEFRQATDVDGKYSDSPILTLENDGKAIVIFRGTEGMAELLDNGQGLYETDTNAQQHAMDYINMLHDEYGYESISVSGHSKGGNKAMYVALLSEYVTDCTAFDAQGFSQAFTEKYKSQIASRSERITLYMPDKSQVGALLYPVAGKTVYTSTDGLDVQKYKLGIFGYHMPDTLYEIDDDGQIRFRREAECSEASRTLSQVSQFLSAAACGCPMEAQTLFLELAETVLGNFKESIGGTMDNWRKGICPDGSPSLSTQIMNFLGGIFPGLEDVTKDWQASMAEGSGSGLDISAALLYLSGHIPVLAAKLAEGTVLVGGVQMAVGGSAVFAAVTAVVIVWAFVKTLELVIPLLLNAGIAAIEICGLALGLAASWIWDKLTGIGQAVKDGFGKAMDGLVRLGSLAVDGARAAGKAVASAVGSLVDGIVEFFRKAAEGASAWIQGIFGSANAAIAYAQDIDVTMSRIEEMRSCLGNLRQCYINAGNAAVGAGQVTDRVYAYYRESYVRSCCGDIQYHLKCARSAINSAERALDRKRRVLAEAIEAYHRRDREAEGTVRRYGGYGW